MTTDTAPVPAAAQGRRSVLPILFGIVTLVAILVIVAVVLSGGAFADPMAGT